VRGRSRALLTAAWWNAALQRGRRLPPLEHFLTEQSAPRGLTKVEAVEEWAHLHTILGE
jgi:hypothetical protein